MPPAAATPPHSFNNVCGAMPDTGDEHHFEFDLDKGIRTQVVEKLESSPLLPLTKGVGPAESGIYALYFKGGSRPVYIGKVSKDLTKSRRTLRGRLNEHVTKIEGRQNIALADMRCRYLTFSSEWWCLPQSLRSSPTTNRNGTQAGLEARSQEWVVPEHIA
jgi:hypothetical protein